MKKINYFLIALFLITGFAGGSNQLADDLVVIDVTKNYPKKELKLQDIMDVEYIPLETTDEFLCPGNFGTTVSDNFIAIWDIQTFFIILFDRTGKGLKYLNYKGQGPREYLTVTDIAIDEDNNEMFVLDMMLTQIFVYDLQGKFIRTFKFQDENNARSIRNFYRESLMCMSFSFSPESKPPFFIISKQDGAFKEFIEIPHLKQVSLSVQLKTGNRVNDFWAPTIGNNYQFIPYRDNWLLVDLSSDTVYMSLPDNKMTPFLTRTPSIHSMNPEVFLIPYMFTDRYYFMESVKKSYNVETRQFPKTQLMYDCKEKAVFEYTMYNDDYPDKAFTIPRGKVNTSNGVVSHVIFESFELVEAYKEGKLKGRLKEIASKLDEDDNQVIMLLKNKK